MMRKLTLLVAAVTLALAAQIGVAAAQLPTPQNCNEFEMIEQSNINGIVLNTPMILLALLAGRAICLQHLSIPIILTAYAMKTPNQPRPQSAAKPG